jgi:thioredoxin-dependent peroxiredoxin
MPMEKLQEYLQKFPQTIVYFYPKDDTPGCTIEAHDFSIYKELFHKNWIWIVWVSKDSESSHQKFIDKQCLLIDLISDEDLTLHKQFGVWWEKNMYGKKIMWVVRSTFLLDAQWTILHEWRNVKAAGHVQKLMEELHIM